MNNGPTRIGFIKATGPLNPYTPFTLTLGQGEIITAVTALNQAKTQRFSREYEQVEVRFVGENDQDAATVFKSPQPHSNTHGSNTFIIQLWLMDFGLYAHYLDNYNKLEGEQKVQQAGIQAGQCFLPFEFGIVVVGPIGVELCSRGKQEQRPTRKKLPFTNSNSHLEGKISRLYQVAILSIGAFVEIMVQGICASRMEEALAVAKRLVGEASKLQDKGMPTDSVAGEKVS
ncbi:uncharacterized protein G2W53_026046 [Senna tora]|uniref:Uncharacterized protein n=1 Tax=Senna tora TaxID=362788 RepID=A0A834TG92_9FABA|nr:uncharacterized protein G2W53_026046 [Senna tora]